MRFDIFHDLEMKTSFLTCKLVCPACHREVLIPLYENTHIPEKTFISTKISAMEDKIYRIYKENERLRNELQRFIDAAEDQKTLQELARNAMVMISVATKNIKKIDGGKF